jgi:signal transduction histidine kinase
MVLDYSQGEAGALPIVRGDVEVRVMLAEIAEGKAEQAKACGVLLHLQTDEAVGMIAVDQKRLAQAVGQVLDNAIRYNREGGEVLLFARWHEDALEIIVSDNGPGISDTEKSTLFDGFARSQQRSAGSVTQGLGLLLARQLVESHGGGLALDSTMGEGTTVVISLPRA